MKTPQNIFLKKKKVLLFNLRNSLFCFLSENSWRPRLCRGRPRLPGPDEAEGGGGREEAKADGQGRGEEEAMIDKKLNFDL